MGEQDMTVALTVTQRQRLVELNADDVALNQSFADKEARDTFFRQEEQRLAKINRELINALLEQEHRPVAKRVEASLISWLTDVQGFAEMTTPLIISEGMLEKMSIGAGHPLAKQVFWLGDKKCLRPMLAPNLYEMMRDIHKVTRETVRIFESGPCFRKETQGAQHMNEFTMLNFVEMAGVTDGQQMERLRELAIGAMAAIGLEDYQLEITESEVYGQPLDILCCELEIASGAYGPHPLDSHWGVFEPWVGLGIGIERAAMAIGGYQNIKRVGRSVAYVNGARLNL